MVSPILAGERVTLTPASFRASIFSWAPPLPPEMMAPAWPVVIITSRYIQLSTSWFPAGQSYTCTPGTYKVDIIFVCTFVCDCVCCSSSAKDGVYTGILYMCEMLISHYPSPSICVCVLEQVTVSSHFNTHDLHTVNRAIKCSVKRKTVPHPFSCLEELWHRLWMPPPA